MSFQKQFWQYSKKVKPPSQTRKHTGELGYSSYLLSLGTTDPPRLANSLRSTSLGESRILRKSVMSAHTVN